jgi:hypothetical protein
MDRSIITIAVGTPYYLGLAENLLKSFLLWNADNEIRFLLVTDNASFYNKYQNNPKVSLKQIDLDETSKSFTSKFKLFDNAFTINNLFVDCDCLIYKDVGFIFEMFEGRSFSAIGNDIVEGDFFCDVKKMLEYFKLTALPKFVGSIYFFKKDAKAGHIFEVAAGLKSRYDELGFVRLRDKENEEPLFAVSLKLENEDLIPNNGTIKADLMYYKNLVSNVLTGKAHASGPIVKITGGEEIQKNCSPAILHFNGPYSESYHYKMEAFRLNSNNLVAINLVVFIKIQLPHILNTGLKNLFRPIYRLFLGYRKIEQSKRMS